MSVIHKTYFVGVKANALFPRNEWRMFSRTAVPGQPPDLHSWNEISVGKTEIDKFGKLGIRGTESCADTHRGMNCLLRLYTQKCV